MYRRRISCRDGGAFAFKVPQECLPFVAEHFRVVYDRDLLCRSTKRKCQRGGCHAGGATEYHQYRRHALRVNIENEQNTTSLTRDTIEAGAGKAGTSL